ncbi:hypothetical protein V6N13_119287 [Hibiscus sabdariffa]
MAHSNEAMRPLANYPQGLSMDQFLSPPLNNSAFESYTKQVEALKKTVKDLLVVPTTDPIQKLHLIYSLCRLGVSYHFENEIEEQLSHLFITLPKLLDDKDYDLHTVAMIFQVFRLNCYKMSCGVFSKFQDDDGKFKEEVVEDVKGMVSLYEASHFRMHGEAILEEALHFTTKHLGSLANQSSTSPHLREYIKNALYRAYHYSLHRYEAKLYIFFYEKEEARNDTLLKLAKYDFNRVQMMYQQELAVLCRFDASAIDKLPAGNKRDLYETVLNDVEEAENLVQKEGRCHGISYVKDEWKKYVRAEQAQCRWRHEGVVPTFEEYLEVGAYTGTGFLCMSQIMLGIEEADRNAYEWILNQNNKFPRALQINSRLYNDIVTDKHKVSRDEATEAFRAIIEEGWKDVNEGCMRPTAIPMPVVRAALNYHRLLDVAYRDNDEYTFSHSFFKDIITQVLLHPIPLHQE